MSTQKQIESIIPNQVTVDRERLKELLSYDSITDTEAAQFVESIMVTALSIWFKDDRDELEERILTDSLAGLMYVIE